MAAASSETSKTILKYVIDTSVLPRELDCMRDLRLVTDKHDGKVIAVDVSREYYDIGRPFIERAGVEGMVDFREGPALEHLDALLADEGNHGAFDFAFVDADKPNYVRYHEQLLRLVRVDGVIVYDDTLWAGMVALPPDAPLSDFDRRTSAVMRDLNAMLVADERVDVCQLTIADGVTICRRLV